MTLLSHETGDSQVSILRAAISPSLNLPQRLASYLATLMHLPPEMVSLNLATLMRLPPEMVRREDVFVSATLCLLAASSCTHPTESHTPNTVFGINSAQPIIWSNLPTQFNPHNFTYTLRLSGSHETLCSRLAARESTI